MSLGVNIKALRILRVLRPLRSLKAIPSMRRLVSTLLQSIPEVGNAGIFIVFVTTLFAILGL
jgi:Ion transport protein